MPYSTALRRVAQAGALLRQAGHSRCRTSYDDASGVSGLDRYRAVLAHMVGHRRWTQRRSPTTGVRSSAWQSSSSRTPRRNPADARISRPAAHIPGAAPKPAEDACDPETDPAYATAWPCCRAPCSTASTVIATRYMLEFVRAFPPCMATGKPARAKSPRWPCPSSPETRSPSDQYAKVHFHDTVVDYRDDNRQMWRNYEKSDDEGAVRGAAQVGDADEESGDCRHAITPSGTTRAKATARIG